MNERFNEELSWKMLKSIRYSYEYGLSTGNLVRLWAILLYIPMVVFIIIDDSEELLNVRESHFILINSKHRHVMAYLIGRHVSPHKQKHPTANKHPGLDPPVGFEPHCHLI